MIGRICENVTLSSDMRNVFCIDGTKQKRIFVADTLIMIFVSFGQRKQHYSTINSNDSGKILKFQFMGNS